MLAEVCVAVRLRAVIFTVILPVVVSALITIDFQPTRTGTGPSGYDEAGMRIGKSGIFGNAQGSRETAATRWARTCRSRARGSVIAGSGTVGNVNGRSSIAIPKLYGTLAVTGPFTWIRYADATDHGE